jgi:rod shape determining protein RodA
MVMPPVLPDKYLIAILKRQIMMKRKYLHNGYENKLKRRFITLQWSKLHLDGALLLGLFILSVIGILILYSASNQNIAMVHKQLIRLFIATIIMLACSQINPYRYFQWAPWVFYIGVILLIAVLAFGKVDKGAKRWLHLGFFDFQPSELMKIAMPLMLAWFFDDKTLPPNSKYTFIASIFLIIPVIIIAKQPDLGTAILIGLSGLVVLVLAGLNYRFLVGLFSSVIISTPILWHFMHQYQKNRVLTFINPERDPLGSGYHIIQSKIALGSGGILGKGFLHGTQSHLHFLPEHATDFIFAVTGEEFGLIGCCFIIFLYLVISARGVYISLNAQSTFSRLLAGSLAFSFIFNALINIGMVTGILPVVGVPLPLISYGGTSMVTMMASFGILMSIHTHRKLLRS